MKVYIKNKIVSLGGSSVVLDENENNIYNVKGKLFSITKKKFIRDMNGNLIYMVRNKWFKWINHSALIYDADGNKVAKVKTKTWKRGYIVEDYTDEIELGDARFWGTTTKIKRNGEEIATITRDASLFADKFELEADEKDIPFLIALVIAVDNITDKKRKEK